MKKTRITRQVKSIADTIFSPSKVFNEINKAPSWLIAYLFISVGTIFIRLLYYPIITQVFLTSIPSDISSEQAKAIAQSAKSITIFSASLSPLYLILKFLIIAITLWLLVQLFTFETEFKKIFSLVVYCEIITFLGSVLTLIILRLRGLNSIKEAADIQVSLGMDIFLGNLDLSIALRTFLSNISIFSVWWIVLLMFGISITCRISRTKSAFIAVFLWLVAAFIQVGVASLIGSLGKIG